MQIMKGIIDQHTLNTLHTHLRVTHAHTDTHRRRRRRREEEERERHAWECLRQFCVDVVMAASR